VNSLLAVVFERLFRLLLQFLSGNPLSEQLFFWWPAAAAGRGGAGARGTAFFFFKSVQIFQNKG
jgi:hypothetical protein